MMESVQAFAEWLAALPPLSIYLVLFGVSYLENLVPPIWGDTLIVLCGWLVGVGTLGALTTVLIATLGGALGFMTLYLLGRRLETAIADPTRLRWIPRAPLASADRWLKRWGMGVVIANRFLAGGRSVISLLAGASRLPLVSTILWSTVSAFLWCCLLVGAGAWVGTRWDLVLDALATYGQIITSLVAATLIVAGIRWMRKRRARREAPQETAKTPPEAPDRGAGR